MAKTSKKQAILDEATLLFAAKGFANTSMTEVAGQLGIAGATIFYHFKSKEELFVAVLERVKTRLLEAFDLYFREEEFSSGLEMLLGAVAYHIHLVESRMEWFSLLRQHHTHDLAEVHPQCRQYLEDIYNCLVDIFENPLKIGQQDGSIGPISTRKNALLIYSMVDGITQLQSRNVYIAGTLYSELLVACRKMVENKDKR